MLRIFRSYLPYNSFLIALLGLVLLIPLWNSHLIIQVNSTDGIIWNGFYKWLGNKLTLQTWLIIPMIIFIGLYMNHLAVQDKMFPKPNHLVALCWIIFSSFFIKTYGISSVWIVLSFLLLITEKILKLYAHSNIKTALYNIGFLYSLAVLIYSPAIYLALLIGVMMLIIRPVYISEWFLMVLGALTPYYLTASVLFLTNQPLSDILPRLHFNNPFALNEINFSVSLVVILLISFSGFVMIQSNMRKLLVHSREAWSAVYLLLLCGLLMLFFGNPTEKQSILFAILPLSFIVAGFFHYSKNRHLPSIGLVILLLWALWTIYR